MKIITMVKGKSVKGLIEENVSSAQAAGTNTVVFTVISLDMDYSIVENS